MLKKIPLQQAVGSRLAHDITEIRPGEFKGPAFRKGHTICEEDLCHLQRLGKNHLYTIALTPDQIHEDQAAAILAGAIAGEGVEWADDPREGKITLHARHDGLLRVDTAALAALNMIDEVMCATLHDHTRVRKGERVAATRAIPLVMQREPIERAAAVARHHGAVVTVRPFRRANAGLIITGSEVYQGLVEDRFEAVLRDKIAAYDSVTAQVTFVPDDAAQIDAAIRSHMALGCDLLMLTGGMSVDPDDVTRHGIRLAGATEIHYGASVLPGAMFLVAYVDDVPILGIPACSLFHSTTALDLILPRVLAGERMGKAALAFMGHGGLCRECPDCNFPHCPFGKG